MPLVSCLHHPPHLSSVGLLFASLEEGHHLIQLYGSPTLLDREFGGKKTNYHLFRKSFTYKTQVKTQSKEIAHQKSLPICATPPGVPNMRLQALPSFLPAFSAHSLAATTAGVAPMARAGLQAAWGLCGAQAEHRGEMLTPRGRSRRLSFLLGLGVGRPGPGLGHLSVIAR